MKTITKWAYYDLILAAVEDGTLPSVDINHQSAFDGSLQPQCYYRHPTDSTKKCVAGLLIPDECYTPAMENKNAYRVWTDWEDIVIHVEDMNADCLREVQRLHDKQFTSINNKWDKEKFLADIKAFPAFAEFA